MAGQKFIDIVKNIRVEFFAFSNFASNKTLKQIFEIYQTQQYQIKNPIKLTIKKMMSVVKIAKVS